MARVVPVFVACICASAFLASPRARSEFRAGDACVARDDATFQVDRGVEMTLSAGDEIKVRKPGRSVTRILVDQVEGKILTLRLEEICKPARDICVVQAPLRLEIPAGDGAAARAFKVKTGAELEVLARRSDRSTVRIGSTEGVVASAELRSRCVAKPGDSGLSGVPLEVAPDAAPEKENAAAAGGPREKLPPSVKVVVLPFSSDGKPGPETMRDLEDQLSVALLAQRSDTKPLYDIVPFAEERERSLQDHLNLARQVAVELGVEFVVTGRVSSKILAEASETTELTLQLAALDVGAGKVLKGLAVKPTSTPGDPWAAKSVEILGAALPALAAPDAPPDEAPTRAPAAEVARSRVDEWPDARPPWYTNGWGYSSLAAATLLAAGGAAVGGWAWSDAQRLGPLTPGTPEFGALNRTAFTKAVVADGLYAGAIAMTMIGGMLFVTGVGLDEPELR